MIFSLLLVITTSSHSFGQVQDIKETYQRDALNPKNSGYVVTSLLVLTVLDPFLGMTALTTYSPMLLTGELKANQLMAQDLDRYFSEGISSVKLEAVREEVNRVHPEFSIEETYQYMLSQIKVEG